MDFLRNIIKKKMITLFIVLIWHFKEFDRSNAKITLNNYEDFGIEIADNVMELHFSRIKNFNQKNMEFVSQFHLIHENDLMKNMYYTFLDSNTGKIGDKSKFRDICNSFKSKWKNALIENFANYNREELEDSFEEIKFDYFSSKSSLAISMQLDVNIEDKDRLINLSRKIPLINESFH